MNDFIPRAWTPFAEWLANFHAQMTTLAPKYGLASHLPQLTKDNEWVQYWVPAKFTARRQEKQLTDYVEAIVHGEDGEAQPTVPVWALPADPPAETATGIKKRLRATARQIKANPLYTEADGELLGIVAPDETQATPGETAPAIELRSLPNFAVEVDFRKNDFDALRVEFRHGSGSWTLAAILTSSPGVFNVVTNAAGQAEQIEVRAVYLIKNQPFGNYSPTYQAVIQP